MKESCFCTARWLRRNAPVHSPIRRSADTNRPSKAMPRIAAPPGPDVASVGPGERRNHHLLLLRRIVRLEHYLSHERGARDFPDLR
jgi:hypothetical protein